MPKNASNKKISISRKRFSGKPIKFYMRFFLVDTEYRLGCDD